MNAGGILASLCFPSFPQFCGQIFANTEDKDLALRAAGLQRLAHRGVGGGAPGRFIPLSLTPTGIPS
jgi:hypothetical protein